MTRLLIALLKGYKKYISPHLGHHCRFVPTCSEYAMQAPEKGKWVNPNRNLTRSK